MQKKDRRLIFLFGGPGSEHDVSCATAKSALPQFADDFVICPVFITKERLWVVASDFVSPHDAWQVAIDLQAKAGIPVDTALTQIEERAPELVFIGLHGDYGEDGTVQALLEGRGLPYTGSDAEASALAMDKPKVLQILQDEGIDVPEFLELDSSLNGADAKQFAAFYHWPIVVLPADGGSSIGVTIVQSEDKLAEAIANAYNVSSRVMVTNYIDGREVSCGLLVTGESTLIALPPTELIPNDAHQFFDYNAKYVAGEIEEITPPNMSSQVIAQIQSTAKRVHQLVGADGYSRVDMIIPNDEPFVLEINTLPGMTPTSILPQEAAAIDIPFDKLLTLICDAVDTTGGEYVSAVSD